MHLHDLQWLVAGQEDTFRNIDCPRKGEIMVGRHLATIASNRLARSHSGTLAPVAEASQNKRSKSQTFSYRNLVQIALAVCIYQQ